ncbi:MAG: aromatic-ring-hydroxylating dioxygenase subunit beta, partial [Acidimicrobiaceae bacterium]|nr:aromatic-ring-hydroxylating dioxygenase subunit beta [Acidimicrobiaceae bacterium]
MDFIHREQALLDERDYRRWLNLLTDDCTYVIGSLDAQARPQDEVVALVYDDRSRIEGRIARLESGFAHAENPPSRTRHFNS